MTRCVAVYTVGGAIRCVPPTITSPSCRQNHTTPLMEACVAGQFKVVKYLCEKANANIDLVRVRAGVEVAYSRAPHCQHRAAERQKCTTMGGGSRASTYR